jgi:His-Xaa-Ser system protein HxsD
MPPEAEFIHRNGTTVVVRASTAVYGVDPVLKAAHKFSARCFVHIEPDGTDAVLCRLRAKQTLERLDVLAGEFCNELLDQALRARLAAATEPVRNLLLAQAFSKTNLIRPDLEQAEPDQDRAGIAAPDDAKP